MKESCFSAGTQFLRWEHGTGLYLECIERVGRAKKNVRVLPKADSGLGPLPHQSSQQPSADRRHGIAPSRTAHLISSPILFSSSAM